MFNFSDESGDLHGDKDGCFVVGGFITGDPRRTARAFRKWQHTKFPRKLRHKTEVKFSDTGMEEKLREQTLAYFMRQDIRIFYAFLKAANIQIADWICGALFHYYAGTDRGTRYHAIMKGSIVASKELFQDFWAEFEHNKKSPPKG